MNNNFIFSIKFFIAALLTLSFASYASTQDSITQYAEQWRHQNDIPALSLYIISPKTNIQILSGHNKMKTGQPLTSDMLFGVGSITKTFVSITILKLEEEGKLKLSDKVGKYFPEYRKWRNVTIKQLLNMTSGIPNATHNKTVLKNMMTKVQPGYTPEKLINIAYQYPLKFESGHGWSYSNTNYVLLGKIIEKITGKPLETVFNDKIFNPYDLHHTIFSNTSYTNLQLKEMVHGYRENVDITQMNPSNLGAAGAAFMNANDLVKWIDALLIQKKVLEPKELKQFLTFIPVPINQPKNQFYGYGLGIFMQKTKKYGEILEYAGVAYGYSSTFVWIPKKHILLIAQINRLQKNHYNYLFTNGALVPNVLKMLYSSKKHE